MKHLVVCLDGTWNDADSPAPQTNIAILARIVEPQPEGGLLQRVHYDTGVGTGGFLDHFVGGALGKGLSANVLAAYRFLSQFYENGDNVYVFGFSRGAFTARSLCGFLAASGLLRADMCNQANLEFAWNYYRTPPKQRFPADKVRLNAMCSQNMRVRFLGVFDTVGALGVPRKALNWIGRHAFEFHDTEVSSVVDHSCHALAIDEFRMEFEAAVWNEPRHHSYKTVEQVWFPGAHSNIGGGYDDRGLSDLTLEWMLTRVKEHCPELTFKTETFAPNSDGKLYDSRTWMYVRSKLRPLMRVINQCALPGDGRYRVAQVRPHSRPIGEMVHCSAVKRWVESGTGERALYTPPNLVSALESASKGRTPIVGRDGKIVTWGDYHAEAGSALRAASLLKSHALTASQDAAPFQDDEAAHAAGRF